MLKTHLKKIIVILLTMIISIAAIVSVNIPNVEAKQKKQNNTMSENELQLIKNKWYGRPCGVPIKLSFEKDFTYERIIGKQLEVGSWELNDNNEVVMDKNKDYEMNFSFNGNKLCTKENDIEYIFTTNPNDAKAYQPAPISTKTAAEDFYGKWNVIKISSGELIAQPKVFGIESATFHISKNKMDITVSGDILPSPLQKEGIELSFNDGQMTFNIDLVKNASGKGAACILDDKTMSINLNSGKRSITLYAEKEEPGN